MSTQHGWNDTGRGKPEYWERNLPQHHSVHHKSYLARPGFEPEPPQRDRENNFYKFNSNRAENIV